MSQYVGAVDVNGNPFDSTTYTPVPATKMTFSLTSDDDGKFKSLSVPSGLSIFQKNIIKGWATQLQINAGEIRRGSKAFVSTEVTSSSKMKNKLLKNQKLILENSKTNNFNLLTTFNSLIMMQLPKTNKLHIETTTFESYFNLLYFLSTANPSRRVRY